MGIDNFASRVPDDLVLTEELFMIINKVSAYDIHTEETMASLQKIFSDLRRTWSWYNRLVLRNLYVYL